MTTLKDPERRLNSIEETLAGHSESIYKLRRGNIENRLGIHRILDHLGLQRVTSEEVDEVLDEE
jgi:hypothetical protein